MSQSLPPTHPMKEKRRALRAQMTRAGLHEAAVKVITREGPEGLTMDRVAQEAGLAKGTLYLYFKSKQDLLESMVQTSMMPLVEELHALLDGPWNNTVQIGQIGLARPD